jgi:23S rRNA (uridine2552-2'-O)-methyltransferase
VAGLLLGAGMSKSGGPGGPQKKQRVKSARGRSTSSTRWLERQLNDPYVHAARKAGWRSRAAFKLIELDDRWHVLKSGQRVLDLGAAPGGWSQVAAQRVQSRAAVPAVVAVDLLPIEPIPGVVCLQLDIDAADAPAQIEAALDGHKADVVLSDMAPAATGHRATDHLRIVALVESAVALAVEMLAPGGTLLAKVWQGGTEATLLADLKRRFASVKHAKPPASRAESAEVYLVAQGFRPEI